MSVGENVNVRRSLAAICGVGMRAGATIDWVDARDARPGPHGWARVKEGGRGIRRGEGAEREIRRRGQRRSRGAR